MTPSLYRAGGPYLADGRTANKKAKPGEVDLDRLCEAIKTSRRILSDYRMERVHAIRQYVGSHYSQGGSQKKVPVNLLARYVQVMSRSLVPKCPRVMFTTKHRDRQPAVAVMQEWMNRRLIAMKFNLTLQRWAMDAIFGVAIMKVALGTPADAAMGGYVSPVGVPFAETVDLDDFAFDSGARDFRQASWIGHRYRMPLEIAESLTYFDSKGRKKLATSVMETQINNPDGDERVNVIGQGWESSSEREYEPMVELWEIYIPRQKRIITLASDGSGVPDSGSAPLRDQEWIGPNCGPYHFLPLMPVPGNPVPKAPIQSLVDLHEFVNYGYRKLVNQFQRQKSVLPVRGGATDDARRLVQANDGEAFSCDNADTIKEVSYGGPNPMNAQFVAHLQDVFNEQAGNLALLAGSAPQSKTATQDKILASGATASVADMQEAMINGIASVLDSMGWFWWNHPQEVMQVPYSAPGVPDVGITRKLYPASMEAATTPQQDKSLRREGRYEDLDCRVDPYSLVYRTPQERLQFLLMLFDKFAPMAQVLAAQGIQMDIQFLMKKIAEYSDEPDVAEMFSVAEPQVMAGGGGGRGPGMAQNTSREYIRRSVGQDTQANRDLGMENAAREFSASESE